MAPSAGNLSPRPFFAFWRWILITRHWREVARIIPAFFNLEWRNMKQKAYARAGVDIELGNRVKADLPRLLASTRRPEVLGKIGGFGGLFALNTRRYRQPVLVASVDGVGTKLKLAFAMDRHDTIGEDLVNHCVNDIAVLGAEPLFFLDYLGTGELKPHVFTQIVQGFARGCAANGCALIGGETAQMPGFYQKGEYDVSGTIVGVVERKRILDGARIRPGDAVIGLGSSGLHTNGYSLARKVFFERMKLKPRSRLEGLDGTVGEELLKVHVSYGPLVQRLLKKFNRIRGAEVVKGLAHITGGGFVDNIPRVLPAKCDVVIRKGILGDAGDLSDLAGARRRGGSGALRGLQYGGGHGADGGGRKGRRGDAIPGHPADTGVADWRSGAGRRSGAASIRRTMKVLVIGSGGREHALVWKLAQSDHVGALWCAPGNVGIGEEELRRGGRVECVPIGAEDLEGLLAFAREKKPDLTVVGPDNPLAMGVVDRFQSAGLRIWGPNRKAAQFESSKVFAQQFMEKHGIPTARAGTFVEPKAALGFAAELDGRCAVKADGLALGKGVLICTGMREAEQAVRAVLTDRQFGAAGATIVIQELLEGIEVSMHALCDGTTARLFPSSQDHKRALEGDQGLNTGGMGAYSPAPFLDGAKLEDAARAILDPWVEGCGEEGIVFQGILYPGLMLTEGGPKVLEFNARFGDPETQVYLTRLENDLVEVLEASVDGTLARMELNWKPGASVCVILASGGYPGSYAKGKVIHGLTVAKDLSQTKVFHAGTARQQGEMVTNGGRVLGVTAWGETLVAARTAAYLAVDKIQFDAMHFRRDIASKALL